MKLLSPAEICKYEWRRELFAQKIAEKSQFTLKNMECVVIESYTHDIMTATQNELRNARFLDNNFQWHKLSDFVKTSEFGGLGEGSSVRRENDALISLNNQLAAIDEEVHLMVGHKFHIVTHAISTPGTPKSDFELVDKHGRSVAWISHKHGTKPTHFQQWGGISENADPFIANHPEVNDFVESIKKKYKNGLVPGTTLYRPLKSGNLKCHSVYGRDSGYPTGKNNVDLVLQGNVKLVYNYHECWHTIQGSTHTHLNGDIIEGNYEPCLYAVYKTDRSDKGIKNARITINPLASRNKRTLI